MPLVSDYTYHTMERGGQKFICIIDLDNGNTSVTNNIENVVAEIKSRSPVNIDDHLVIYRDSIKQWDAWEVEDSQFIFLNAKTSIQAIDNYLKILVDRGKTQMCSND